MVLFLLEFYVEYNGPCRSLTVLAFRAETKVEILSFEASGLKPQSFGIVYL